MVEGQVLTATNTLADKNGLGSISYQWTRDGSNIGKHNVFNHGKIDGQIHKMPSKVEVVCDHQLKQDAEDLTE